jgi:hypothetical protein
MAVNSATDGHRSRGGHRSRREVWSTIGATNTIAFFAPEARYSSKRGAASSRRWSRLPMMRASKSFSMSRTTIRPKAMSAARRYRSAASTMHLNYRLDANHRRHYVVFTGCGNSFNSRDRFTALLRCMSTTFVSTSPDDRGRARWPFRPIIRISTPCSRIRSLVGEAHRRTVDRPRWLSFRASRPTGRNGTTAFVLRCGVSGRAMQLDPRARSRSSVPRPKPQTDPLHPLSTIVARSIPALRLR